MPSQLNARPIGEPLQAAAVLGNGANWFATPASESSVTFTLSVNAQPRAVACAWMIALYRACNVAKNCVSAGSMTGGAVQFSVTAVVAPAARRPKPYGNGTSTALPPGGAQFASTLKSGAEAANAPLAHSP